LAGGGIIHLGLGGADKQYNSNRTEQ